MAEPRGTGADVLAWAQERWRWIAAVLLVVFLFWRFSGSSPEKEAGRFVLVKDDVPCQAQRDEDDGRRWCYVVMDTRTGKLEERVRRFGSQKRK